MPKGSMITGVTKNTMVSYELNIKCKCHVSGVREEKRGESGPYVGSTPRGVGTE